MRPNRLRTGGDPGLRESASGRSSEGAISAPGRGVFEHVGKSTFPASVFLANRYGRIVICGATTGYQLTFDVRHLWMRQKQIIGSHFADADSCRRANALMRDGKVKPVLTRVFTWEEIPEAHQLMYENKLHGTVACLVGAARPGLTSYGESLVGRADR